MQVQHEVRSIEIQAPFDRAFEYIADPARLPEWTSAFESASRGHAVMRTPRGSVEVDLEVRASRAQGTIDWTMRFPDQSEARAHSRLVALGEARSVYTFLLTPPPVPLEQLEGALEEQSRTLREELARLSRILGRLEPTKQ